jgi:TolB-like protein
MARRSENSVTSRLVVTILGISWTTIASSLNRLVIIVIICLTASICEAAERKIIGNTFHSDDPSLNIIVNQEFRYLGKTDNLKSKKIGDSYEDYFFLPQDSIKGSPLTRYLFIQIRSREKEFKDNTPQNVRYLDFGSILLGNNNFNYFKRIEVLSPTSLTYKFFQKREYIVPRCLITNTFYSFPNKNKLVSIIYNEDATLFNMSCDTPYSRETLSENQRSHLSDFHKRAFASIGLSRQTLEQQTAAAKSFPAPKGKDDLLKKKDPINQPDHRISVSVFAFKPGSLDAAPYGPQVTTELINALKGNPTLNILDRRDLEEFLLINELQQNDSIDNILNIGRRLGLNFIVSGIIEKDGSRIVLNCIAVDIYKAEIAYRRKIQVLGNANLEAELKKISDGISAAISSRTY